MQLHYCEVTRMTIEFAGDDLELVERACRALAERARHDAEAVPGTPVEYIHKTTQSRFLRMAERIKIARSQSETPPPIRPQA
jgi:hypothetical protein